MVRVKIASKLVLKKMNTLDARHCMCITKFPMSLASTIKRSHPYWIQNRC